MIAVISILASLVLSTAGFIQYKGAISRAEAEIAAFSAALQSYKADHGEYPAGSVNPDSTSANSILVAALMPLDENENGKKVAPPPKVYFEFNKNMLPTNGKITNAIDPFGEPYGNQYPGNVSRSGTNFFDLELGRTGRMIPTSGGRTGKREKTNNCSPGVELFTNGKCLGVSMGD